ncbi:MAG: translation initiation factor IF-2 [Phycisphaeraceae bacterium]|nr:translation initiation factor IF-2 [Phycisphaeraceae bacterium]
MAKRIHDIAKELGIKSKAIIEKCLAEGIPSDKVKNHMAVLSPGLEASIREWFAASVSGEAPSATAVETTAHVDIEKVRAKPRRRTASKDSASAGDSSATSVAEADAESTETVEPGYVQETAKAAPVGHGHGDDEPTDAEDVTRTEAPAPRATPVEDTPAAGAAKEEVQESEAVAPPAEPQPSARPVPEEPREESPRAPGHGPARGGRATVSPAPMNVPERPKVVAPAGKRLEIQTPVKLSGPRVVRIEAPEVIDRPKPRRIGTGDGGPRGPMAPGGGSGASDDDRGRVARRAGGNKRRTDGLATPTKTPRRKADEPPAGVFSEQDLAEREARLARAGGYLKKRRHDLKMREQSHGESRATASQVGGGVVRIAAPFTIKDLSAATGVKSSEILKKLLLQGIMATANSGIDTDKAQEIMIDFNIELETTEARTAEQVVTDRFVDREAIDLRPRGPIVTILGHVDHGKTSLLDKIRNANVAAGEAGGITQATSAFKVPVTIGGETKTIVFLDTPGHEAFTQMRSRGAALTDVVVLVVSAPEGVMPQTVESINHAKAAGVPIVVALNKVDRPDATEARINQTLSQLADQGLNPVEWGGTTEVVHTSATKGVGIDKLLEILDLQGQLLELKADCAGPARGTVVEARLEEGRGPVASVIVQDGELKVGDFIVVGRAFGKVRDIVDDRGERLKSVTPPAPVQVSGFDELPDAGDKFFIVHSLKEAQEAAEQRRHRMRQAALAQPKVTLDSLFSQMAASAVKEILVVLKADVQGSVDVIKHEIEKIATKEVKARVLHAAVGGINESDVLLANASNAIIIGFNVIAANKARQLAEAKGVEIRTYQVIYEITDDIRKAAEGLLEPERRQEVLGHAEVRRVYKLSKFGAVAGCYVTDGVIERNALIRVTRNGVVIENDRVLEQLKRFKDDAKEVKNGTECGMKIVGYDDIKEGDVLECYKNIEVKRTL